MNAQTLPFTRYIIRGPSSWWWGQNASNYLLNRNWELSSCDDFRYEESYGYEGALRARGESVEFDYCTLNGSVILEYKANPQFDSILNPNSNLTVIDDLLAFLSMCSGIYCQYLWKEVQLGRGQWSAWTQLKIGASNNGDQWAVSRRVALSLFDRALNIIPRLNRTQFDLAVRWYLSALREYEIGRPLVEIAMCWVVLESQANYLNLSGNKRQKVEQLLNNQGFPVVPKLQDIYKLRNDAFHDGTLSNLSEASAQQARLAARALARAQILNLLGVDHSEFRQEFVDKYAT